MSQAISTFGLCTRCARTFASRTKSTTAARSFSSSFARQEDIQQQLPEQNNASPMPVEPAQPQRIGSRRRQAALESTSNIPFTQLPYQCFQEALTFLREDRAEKVSKIEEQRKRIARLEAKLHTAATNSKPAILVSIESSKKHLEYLKVQADINDPLVKRRFEDGLADMSKPVYRHLARRKWEDYERKIVMQRIEQLGVVPDVLPLGNVEPSVQLRATFAGKKVAHGVVVPSTMTEKAPTLHIQSFEAGEKLVSIVVLDSDIPNPDADSFDHRLHALITNVKIDPANATVNLRLPADSPSLVVPWLPPTAQKGAPWHRLSIWVLQQPNNTEIDVESLKKWSKRDGFTLRAFHSRYMTNVLGVTMFRTKWDEGMAGVMERNGIEGADVEYKKKPIEPMRYKKKDGKRFR